MSGPIKVLSTQLQGEQDIMSNTLHFEGIFNSNLSWGFKYFKDSKLLTFLNRKREKYICTVLDQCTNLE